jgi:hypothetical protein
MKKNANKWLKILDKGKTINEAFEHFNLNQWIYDTAKT